MEEERIPKIVINGNFYTSRPVGRPRIRWTDVVQRDALQLMGIRGWRGRAENREAKAWKGLERHIWMDNMQISKICCCCMCCLMAGERLKLSQLVGGHFYRISDSWQVQE
jgi:hypothetical protein